MLRQWTWLRGVVCWRLLTVKPLITSDGAGVESLVGRDVRLTCVVLAGNPAPHVTWTRLGGEPASSGVRVVDDGSGSLYLKNVSVDDAGEYVCTASNVAGTASNSVTLDVLGNYTVRQRLYFAIVYGLSLQRFGTVGWTTGKVSTWKNSRTSSL